MVPAPIVIKLKPVQTKKIIATTHANPSRSPEFDDKPDFSPEMITNPARHDSNIAERTPIDELRSGKHHLPMWAEGLFDITPEGQPRRRRKLTHLSPEEKVLRRKLKNRVAAQNARDKKRNEAETLRSENDELRDIVKKLQKDALNKQAEIERLRSANATLADRLGLDGSVKEESYDLLLTPGGDSVVLCPIADDLSSGGTPATLAAPLSPADSLGEKQELGSDAGSSPAVRVGPGGD